MRFAFIWRYISWNFPVDTFLNLVTLTGMLFTFREQETEINSQLCFSVFFLHQNGNNDSSQLAAIKESLVWILYAFSKTAIKSRSNSFRFQVFMRRLGYFLYSDFAFYTIRLLKKKSIIIRRRILIFHKSSLRSTFSKTNTRKLRYNEHFDAPEFDGDIRGYLFSRTTKWIFMAH